MALVKPWSLHRLASAAPGGRLLAAPRNQRCMRACASVVRHSHGDADAPTPECDHGDSSFAARFNASYGAVVGALVGDAAGAPAEFPVVGTLVSSLRHVMYAPLRVLGMQRGRALPSPRVLFSMPGHGARSQRQPTLGDVWAAVRAHRRGEFLPPSTACVELAMSMGGGGKLGVAPGQVTDDGELTMTLLGALASDACITGDVDLSAIAVGYQAWLLDKPFDMGLTTYTALQESLNVQSARLAAGASQVDAAYAMHSVAQRNNAGSKANGSVMRASPIAVWGHRLPLQAVGRLAAVDSALTHPNPTVCVANGAYCIAIAHLIQSAAEDSAGSDEARRHAAYQAALAWAEQHDSVAGAEVALWLKQAAALSHAEIGYWPSIGFVRLGFTHAFRHLMCGTPFEAAIEETITGGGDTDTNAAIVGGLLGAVVGYEGLPQRLVKPVLECDTRLGAQRRKLQYHPSQAKALVERLCSHGPSDETSFHLRRRKHLPVGERAPLAELNLIAQQGLRD